MENRAHALIAGLFVLLLGLGVLGTVWWLSGNREATREVLLVTQRTVTGLNPQAQVRFRGVRSGKVQDIYLDPKDPSTIVVRVTIGRDIPLTTSTTAEIKPQGITGLAYVELQDAGLGGASLAATAGEPPRIALKPSTVELISEDVMSTLANVRALTKRITALVSEQNVERVSQTLANVEAATAHVASATEQMPQVVSAVRETLSPQNVQRIGKLIEQLEKTGRETAPLVAELRALVASAQSAAARINALSEDAGGVLTRDTLPRVGAVLQDVAGASRQVSRAIERLEQEPQSLLFGPAAAAPGPGEPGFVAPAAR